MSRDTKINAVLVILFSLVLSYVSIDDPVPSAAHRDAIASAKQEAHLVRAELAIAEESK